MDIRTLLDKATDSERHAIDAILGEPVSGWQGSAFTETDGHVAYGGRADRERRHLLLPALHATQDAIGAVSRGALAYISERLTIPPAEAYGVATFYALFRVDHPGGATTHVCDDIVCAARDLDADDRQQIPSPCLGQCDRAPGALTHTHGLGYQTPPSDTFVHSTVTTASLLERVGVVDPEDLDAYRVAGGYRALTRAVEMGPEGVIAELEKSGLRGRGGAAFPIGLKWAALAKADGHDKYVVGNGDESEPGTFKDRVLMEGDPFAVVEAMTVYGYATGASRGYLYVRGEYPTAESRLREAIDQAYAADLLGENAAGAGFDFDLEVRRGAGAYVCGEETALFASIEGYRGEPRQKPPFPTQSGLFGKPTGINNIETLLAALQVVLVGGEDFARIGTEQSTGPKLFSVSGDVGRPGVYEVPFGKTLRELLDLARPGPIGAILMGGAAGSFVDDFSLDMELSFEGAREVGTTLGSGAVVVFDDTTDFGPVLARIARFFRDESCGQCVPCRIGTVRQEEALLRIHSGSTIGSRADELDRLEDLARVMTDASICGLGQTAASAIQSAIALELPGVPR